MDDECIRMHKATDQTFMMPTMSTLYSFLEFGENMPRHYVEKATKIVGILKDGMIAAREAGLKIGWGTDAGVYEGSHGNGIYEFRVRVNKMGFTPLETLMQATKFNSEILQIDDQVGTIKAGKKANLAAFDGNPDQESEVLNSVAAVFKNGIVVNI